MRQPTAPPARAAAALLGLLGLLGLLLSVTACSSVSPAATGPRASDGPAPRASAGAGGSSAGAPSASSGDSGPASASAQAHYAVPDPGHLTGALHTADLLVAGASTIPEAVRRRVRHLPGVIAVLPLSLSSVPVNGRALTVASGDLARLRRFTQWESARADAVWSRVADGELAVDPSLPRRLEDPRGYLRLGASRRAPRIHIGAYAPLVRQISAVVDLRRARQLGMPTANALLVSTGSRNPSTVTGPLRQAIGARLTLQTLALEFDAGSRGTAVLSGTSVASRVGTFTYTPHADGSVTPDPAWVHRYIRTEPVPLLGRVTCNRGMLPQLRGALEDVVREGLADRIHPREYGGCYNPRFIAHDPAKGLSLHTWGIAVDLNVPGNQRGTAGLMDRRVVAIFERWGFAWGGDWHYTDPMHFEMAGVVRAAAGSPAP